MTAAPSTTTAQPASRRWHALGCAALLLAACRSDWEPPQPHPPQPPAPEPAAAPGPPAPVIDGRFDDWGPHTLVARDRTGDADGAFDVSELHAQSRGSELFVHFDTGALLNLASGPAGDGDLILTVALPNSRELAIDFRARDLRVDGGSVSSYQLGYVASPTHAGRAFELRLDLAAYGVAAGSTIQLQLSGSDTLAPVPFTFADGPAPALDANPQPPPASQLRIASLNTYQRGLTDPARQAAITRLLAAARADVYTFQELGNTSAAAIAARLEAADPHHDGAGWHAVVQSSGNLIGNAVASRSALLGIPTPTPRFTGAVVLLPNTGPVAVFSVHLKCCGHIGSAEDQTRLQQAGQLAATVDALRAGTINDALQPYATAPVLVAGDFNHVGSPELHLMLERPRAPQHTGLRRLTPRHLRRAAVYTWYDQGASFPPGALDLLFFDPRLAADNAFVLDSRQMDDAMLDALSLQPYDSQASDHLLLVADFHLGGAR